MVDSFNVCIASAYSVAIAEVNVRTVDDVDVGDKGCITLRVVMVITGSRQCTRFQSFQ